ncbi:gp43 [Gordonia sp. NB41Y]|uniref:gp43 n=1 Tax=Gordonia sp. NB41Y TaxID=875808 RepID=UPI0002BDF324|nr:gp43 [Gordonia sp. NB41Y]EMP10028.1 hypothetical protein ISGA_1468 [Gordonia sp. NB41Y]WLP90218.1 hypothetical protein Q9K23_22330 [Gordonia sp. NB41Y]
MPTYHPWRDARRRSHLDIAFVDHLPAGVRGRIRGDRIEINRHMLADERRCTIAHELVHDERRVFPVDRVLRAREELVVERIAARRLIALDQLVDVLRWTRHADEVAEELWVDVPMLVALVQSLTDRERDWIEGRLDDQGSP